MGGKRTRLQIIYDILKVVQGHDGTIKPTQIIYKANLSHEMLEEYLSELLSKSFIIEQTTKRGKTYKLTDKGCEYISKYALITDFVESFGLVPEYNA